MNELQIVPSQRVTVYMSVMYVKSQVFAAPFTIAESGPIESVGSAVLEASVTHECEESTMTAMDLMFCALIEL